MAEITGGEIHYDFTMDPTPFIDGIKNFEGRIKGFTEIIEESGQKSDLVFDKSGKALKEKAEEAKKILFAMTEFSTNLIFKQEQLVSEMNKIPKNSPQYTVLSAEARELAEELHSAAVEIPYLAKVIKEAEFQSQTAAQKVSQLKIEMQDLTAAGKENSREFRTASEDAAKYQKAIDEANKTLKGMVGGGLSQAITGLNIVSGIVSTSIGTFGLLTDKKEELQKIDEKLNSIIAVAVGLQQLSLNVTQAQTIGTNFFSAAQTRLATAFGLSAAGARVLLGTLTLGLAVAIPVIITLVSKYIEKQKEAAKTQNELNKAMEEGTVAAAADVVQLKVLYSAATNVALSTKERERNVRELQKAFPEHFGNIDKEIILNGKAKKSYDDLVGSIIAASKARALEKVLTERQEALFKKQEQLRKERDGFIDDMKKSSDREIDTGNGIVLISGDDARRNNRNKAIQKETEAMKVELDFNKHQNGLLQEINKLKQEGRIDDGLDKTKSTKTKVASGTKPGAAKADSKDEVYLIGSLANLQEQLSKVQEAYRQTNDKITRDTLKQQELIIDAKIKAIENEYVIKEDEAAKEKIELEKKLQEFLVSQRNYEEKVTAIKEQYSKLRSVATTDDERARIDAGMQADLQKLASDELKKSKAWIDAFGEIEIYTAQKLAEVRAALLAELQRMEADGSATPEAVKAVQDQLKKIDIQANKSKGSFAIIAEGIATLGKEGKYTKEDLENLKTAVSEVQDNLKFLGDAVGDVKTIFSDLGVEMDSTFGDVLESIQGAIEGLEQVGDGVQGLLAGLENGNPIQAAAGIIKAVGGAIKAVTSFINGDKKKERDIKKQAVILGELATAYNDLAFAAERAFGSQKYSGQTDLIRNLEQQKAVLQEMANAEGGKKKGDKEKIAGYQSQIQTINQSIASLKEGIIKDVLQTDIPDMAAKMGDALVEAFGRGEDGIKAVNDSFNDMVKNILKNQLNKLLEDQMKDVKNKLLAYAGFNPDGTGNFDGFTAGEIAELKAMYEAAAANGKEFIDAYGEIFGGIDSQSSSLSGAIKGITEQTGGILAGQLNAMRINQGESLKNQVTGHSIARNSLLSLVKIEQNTASVHNEIYDLNKRLKSKGF